MIENRYRLEKQILLGRQAVRRALKTKSQERISQKIEGTPQEGIPAPMTGTRFPTTSMLIVPTLSEGPLPVDTDAESAYFNGSQTGRGTSLPTHTGGGSGQDAVHSSKRRRKWSGHRPNRAERGIPQDGNYGAATPDPPPPPTEAESEEMVSTHAQQASSSAVNPVGFLRRLGNGSMSASFSPFGSLRRNSKLVMSDSNRDSLVEPSWSGDSTSDDDDLSLISRRHRHPSVFDLRSDMDKRFSEDEGGGADYK